MKEKLVKFNSFLSGIDLDKYRDKYSKIKLVELDLPRNIQALNLMYKYYWKEFNLLDYTDFYSAYSSSLKNELEEFRIEQMFSEETFYRGLPARIYRTWASLLTQIQGGYVASSIYPKVDMSEELDRSGIDIEITTANNQCINIQIKKESFSREVRAPWKILKKDKEITTITYEVIKDKLLTKTGKESKPYKDWSIKWKDKLQKLDNGFIIFLPEMFSLDQITTP